MTTRLNKHNKQGIAEKVLKHGFTKRYEDLAKRMADFTNSVWLEALPQEQREIIRSKPVCDWLQKDTSIYAFIAGQRYTLYWSGINSWLLPGNVRFLAPVLYTELQSHPMPHGWINGVAIDIPADDVLRLRWDELREELESLNEAASEAMHKTMATLDSFASVEALIKGWPEVEAFAMPYKEEATPAQKKQRALAVPIDQLNTMLDLPPETETAADARN